MLKKSVTLPALRAMAVNRRSRQNAMPPRPGTGTIVWRDKKNDVSMKSISRPTAPQASSARTTSGRFMKP